MLLLTDQQHAGSVPELVLKVRTTMRASGTVNMSWAMRGPTTDSGASQNTHIETKSVMAKSQRWHVAYESTSDMLNVGSAYGLGAPMYDGNV